MLYRSECNSIRVARRVSGGALSRTSLLGSALLLLFLGMPARASAVPSAQENASPPQERTPPPVESDAKPPASPKAALTPAEKDRLRRAGNLSAQMKVFVEVAQQYLTALRDAADQGQGATLRETALLLSEVYRQAVLHMQQSPEKKKQKHLKKFEIALREQISLLKSLQSLSDYMLRDAFTPPIEAGERARKDALKYIFEGGSVKKP